MDKIDVIKARNFLRVTYKKKVFDKDTGAESVVDDMIPLAVEFDNSMACSEEADLVFWDDTDGFVYFVQFNNNQVRGAQPILGTEKPLNPAAVFAIDYSEIQQFRMVVNEEGLDAILDKIKDTGCKVNYGGAEVEVTDDILKRAKSFIFDKINPAVVIEQNKLLKYK